MDKVIHVGLAAKHAVMLLEILSSNGFLQIWCGPESYVV